MQPALFMCQADNVSRSFPVDYSPEQIVPYSLESILASERIPSLPEVAARIVEIARDPDPNYDQLIETIRTDPAIAGRILKTANSALLGMRTRANSIEQAVPRLGTTMVRTLVLGFCLAEYQNRNSFNLRRSYQMVWRESLTQAAVAEALGERQGGKVDPANWFLAGLLQDIGRLALLHTCGEAYVENVLEPEDERTQRQREQEWLGFTHVEVSQGLCRKWNLESEFIDAIGVHHASAHRVVPLKFVSSTSLPAALITATHVSEYLEEVSHNLSCSREHIERLLMQVFALRPNDVFRVLADIDSRVGELSATFGIDVGRPPALESILAEAQELLGQIALASQLRLVNANPRIERLERIRLETAESLHVREAAWKDNLTGAFNRGWLEPALSSVIDQAHQHQVPIGLLLIDLDNFRGLNQEAGPLFCDMLLQKATAILRECVRLSDSVVRYGGDEFVITLKDVNSDMLTMVCDQIRSRIRSELSTIDPSRHITCSIGVAYYAPQSGIAVRSDSLIREADKSVSAARRKGGDQAVMTFLEGGKWMTQVLEATIAK
ncbi:MAG: GGDEF domain-containing protein [Planctomycetota bacterium]|nr:MAG: GGDEF domain-containing protein [Planctomycetota bacterium]